MTAEKFRPKFTTSAKAAEERKEARGEYFGSNVSVTEGTKPPSRVVPSPIKFKGLKQAIDFDAAQADLDKEIKKNKRRRRPRASS